MIKRAENQIQDQVIKINPNTKPKIKQGQKYKRSCTLKQDQRK